MPRRETPQEARERIWGESQSKPPPVPRADEGRGKQPANTGLGARRNVPGPAPQQQEEEPSGSRSGGLRGRLRAIRQSDRLRLRPPPAQQQPPAAQATAQQPAAPAPPAPGPAAPEPAPAAQPYGAPAPGDQPTPSAPPTAAGPAPGTPAPAKPASPGEQSPPEQEQPAPPAGEQAPPAPPAPEEEPSPAAPGSPEKSTRVASGLGQKSPGAAPASRAQPIRAAPAPADLQRPSSPRDAGAASTGDLAKQVSEQSSALARQESRLVKLERKQAMAAVGVGALGAAGIAAFLGVAALLAAVVLALDTELKGWFSAALVGVVLLVLAGVTTRIAKKKTG
ncbi:MAG: phage holin family protein [Thermoleophilaceae bacterium]